MEREPIEVKEGALHRQLGLKKDEKFNKKDLVRLSKVETGEMFEWRGKQKKMTKLLKKRAVFALNFGFRERKSSPRFDLKEMQKIRKAILFDYGKGYTYEETIKEMERYRADTDMFYPMRESIMERFFFDMEHGKFKTLKEIRRVSKLIYEHCVNS